MATQNRPFIDPFQKEMDNYDRYPAYTPEKDLKELALTKKFFQDHIPTDEFKILDLKNRWRHVINDYGLNTDYFDAHWPLVEKLLVNPGYYQMMLDYETWRSPSYFGYIVDTQTGQMAKSMEVAFGIGTRLDGERFKIPEDDISRWIMLRLPAFVYFRERALTVAGKMHDFERTLLEYGFNKTGDIKSILIGGGRFMEGRFCKWIPHPAHTVYVIEQNPADDISGDFEHGNVRFLCKDYCDIMYSGRFNHRAHNVVFTGGVPYLLREDDFLFALEGALHMLRFGGYLYVDDLIMTPCTLNGVMTQNWGRFAGAPEVHGMKPNQTLEDLEAKFHSAVARINADNPEHVYEIEDEQISDAGTDQPFGALFTIKRVR
ncbi:hypothetical protein IJG98_03110 [Candidatus Saccharibacteria bacterium]|nr:hypothetical protein [Candidatus Saccharibacteria bacterium]